MVFKDGIREGEEANQLSQCREIFLNQKNCILQIVNQADGKTDVPLDLKEQIESKPKDQPAAKA